MLETIVAHTVQHASSFSYALHIHTRHKMIVYSKQAGCPLKLMQMTVIVKTTFFFLYLFHQTCCHQKYSVTVISNNMNSSFSELFQICRIVPTTHPLLEMLVYACSGLFIKFTFICIYNGWSKDQRHRQ